MCAEIHGSSHKQIFSFAVGKGGEWARTRSVTKTIRQNHITKMRLVRKPVKFNQIALEERFQVLEPGYERDRFLNELRRAEGCVLI
jgi:hypothetical protein